MVRKILQITHFSVAITFSPPPFAGKIIGLNPGRLRANHLVDQGSEAVEPTPRDFQENPAGKIHLRRSLRTRPNLQSSAAKLSRTALRGHGGSHPRGIRHSRRPRIPGRICSENS
jgi:hypothetical protein